MGEHATHTMHAHSIEALATYDRARRFQVVLGAYLDAGKPQTDREIAERLGFPDMNAVRPAITKMIQAMTLRECGEIKDHKTNRTVRLVEVMR